MAYAIEIPLWPQYRPLFQLVGGSRDVHQLDWLENHERTPIKRELMPFRAEQISKHKRINDFFTTTLTWCVCEEFKNIVESLEPGIHQFFPIEVVRRSGEPTEKTYYQLVIGQRLEALDVERSNVKWIADERGGGFHAKGPGEARWVLRRDIVAGKHLWRPLKHFTYLRFCSDELMAAVEKAGLKKLGAVHAEEI